jgi:HK97 family phage prohead protease
MKMHRRSTTSSNATGAGSAELRAAKDSNGALRVSGYFARFDSPSEPLYGRFIETIDKRAFDDVLRGNPDVRFLENHAGLALARTTNGTLKLSIDDAGVRFDAELNPEMQAARDLYAAIERGDVSQMSFGFDAEWERAAHAPGCGADCCMVHERITRVTHLYEASAVTFPAYESTDVEARNAVTDDTPPSEDADDVETPGDEHTPDELATAATTPAVEDAEVEPQRTSTDTLWHRLKLLG